MEENKILGFAYNVYNGSTLTNLFKLETYVVCLNKDNTVYYAKMKEYNLNDDIELNKLVNDLDQSGYKTTDYWYYEIRSIMEERVIRKKKKVYYGKDYNY